MFGWDKPGANPKTYMTSQFIQNLEGVEPLLANEARAMQSAGASYEEIVNRFEAIFDRAAVLREEAT
jgi:hypothetical protein